MRIRNQFTITLIIFSLILIIIGSSIIFTSQQVTKTRTQENLANRIVHASSDLTYLSSDYVFYKGSQQLNQWQVRYASFYDDVESLSVDKPEQQALVQSIQTNQRQMKTVFDSIVSSVGTFPNQDANQTLSTLQVSWSRMSIQSQILIDDASKLAELLGTQVDQLNMVNIMLIFVMITTFSVFLAVIYFQTFRRTLKSINELRKGTDIIGEGNLDFKLKDDKKDEISELSYAFNQMTTNLKTANHKLKDSERLAAIGATAGMVGHDIRNPLQAITSDVYLAKTELADLPESKEKKNSVESLEEIEKNIDYINKIVADLQDFARPLKPKIEEANFKIILDELFARNVLPENVDVVVKIQPEAVKFVADCNYLTRIMYNLVTNAVQAMPSGGKLTIQAYNEANYSLIAVNDTGVGIPESVKEKLFTPMFTTKSKGQGFGLAVIKRMTEALGGTVTFESKEGKGTTFIVRLPSYSKS